jgi:hypothetical protein
MASTDNAESRPLPFKKQLDKAAENAEAKERPPSPPNPIVKKITNMIPAATAVLGDGTKKDRKDEQQQPPPPPGPPERSQHDLCIEEFVRAQHRSMHEDGTLEGAKD